jgi:hypothetical protein
MRNERTRALLVAAAAGVLTLAIAAPASAALTAATSATVTVAGGALSITAPASAGNLGSITNTVLGGTISGPLGQVQVNDARSAAAGAGSTCTEPCNSRPALEDSEPGRS